MLPTYNTAKYDFSIFVAITIAALSAIKIIVFAYLQESLKSFQGYCIVF